MDRNKKIFIFVLVALVAIAIALLLYYFFSSSNGGTTPGGGGTFPPGGGSSTTSIPPGGSGAGTGGTGGGSGGTGGGGSGGGGQTTGAFKPILRQVTTVPTAGGVVFEKSDKSYIRYMERAKGNVYETDATSIKAVRLSNNTIPQIYGALWNKTGSNLIARFLKDGSTIQTFSATVVPKGNGEGELRGEYLTSDIKDLALSPSGTQISYLVNNPDGVSGILASFDGRKKVQIFDSPLSEWLLDWPKEDIVTVTSKAGAGSNGLLMFINTGTGKKDVILSGIGGLTTLTNSDASKVLYSVSSQGTLSAKLFDVTSKLSSIFSFTTLPEKCVWSHLKKNVVYCAVPESLPSATYPDSWYQGIVSLRDEIWKIDVGTGVPEFIMNLGDQSKTSIDAESLSLNSKENFILLINKNDLTLWEIQLSQ